MPRRPATPRTRLEIQDVDCVLLDATLTLTFDEKELRNLLGPAEEDGACAWHGAHTPLEVESQWKEAGHPASLVQNAVQKWRSPICAQMPVSQSLLT